ncbi:MAG TPA: TolC family protein, partial [Polyangiaceae bacterium]
MNERRRLASACVLALSVTSIASAQTAPAPGAATPAEGTPAAPPPTAAPTPRALAHADTTGLEPISRNEAVNRAMQNSPALRLAEIDVKSAKAEVEGEQGRYPFYFGADAGYTRSGSAQLRRNDTVSSSSSHSVTGGVGLSRQFKTGTSAELRAEGEYFHNDSPSAAAGVTPFAASGYGASFRASVSQPLLRGYGTRIGEADLRAARVAQKASEKSLLRTRSALIGDVLSAYFELWYSSRAVDIETTSLALAREQLDQASARFSLGDISKVDLLTFQTRASELEEALIAAELGRQQRSVALSQLMGQAPPAADLFASTEPGLDGQRFDFGEVETAMRADSVELAELEQQVKLARTQAEVAGESWRPRLDVEAWAQSAGVSTEFPNAWGRAAGGQYW